MAIATGLVYYTLDNADVNLLLQIGIGRRKRLLPAAAGEEYAAVVTRSPVPDAPGDDSYADLLVFVNGSTPFFVKGASKGTGQPGTFNAAPQKTVVG